MRTSLRASKGISELLLPGRRASASSLVLEQASSRRASLLSSAALPPSSVAEKFIIPPAMPYRDSHSRRFSNISSSRGANPIMDTTIPYKKAIVFDLDDTLHDFSGASKKAIQAMCGYISKRSGVDQEKLSAEYKEVCKIYVTSFTDGRTSHDYRLERMKALLEKFSLYTPDLAKECVDLYGEILRASLKLEDGAIDLLAKLKERGVMIAVVSEGPHDAQVQTIKDLGIAPYVDMLMTSNQERVSKKDGLFGVFLEKAKISREHVVVIGDSLQNDVISSQKHGILAVHYAKNGGSVAEKSVTRLLELLDKGMLLDTPKRTKEL